MLGVPPRSDNPISKEFGRSRSAERKKKTGKKKEPMKTKTESVTPENSS